MSCKLAMATKAYESVTNKSQQQCGGSGYGDSGRTNGGWRRCGGRMAAAARLCGGGSSVTTAVLRRRQRRRQRAWRATVMLCAAAAYDTCWRRATANARLRRAAMCDCAAAWTAT